MPSNIIGRVLDNNKRPVGDVKISIKGKYVAVSKEDGAFCVTMAKAESRAALTFVKNGFVPNTKIFNTKALGKRTIIIWPVAYKCAFMPNRDLDITLGGANIKVPANALMGTDGKKIKDKVNLQFTLFDVTNRFQCSAAPGDFTGVMLSGKVGRLNSFGVFDFGIYDQKGKPVKLIKGAEVGLSIPVSPRIIKITPKTVGYFSLDTNSGMWVQLSNFTLVPKAFLLNGNITRLGGEHNLDNWQDTACVTIQVINMWDSAPMPQFYVEIAGLQYQYAGMTDNNGRICLCVQKNASFSVIAYGGIGQSFYHTIEPVVFYAPDIVSDLNNCGDPVLCPFLGTVQVDLFTED